MEVFGAMHCSVPSGPGTHPLENTAALRNLFNRNKTRGIALIKESRACFIWLPLGRKQHFKEDILRSKDQQYSGRKAPSRSIAKKFGSMLWKYKVSKTKTGVGLKGTPKSTPATTVRFELPAGRNVEDDAKEQWCGQVGVHSSRSLGVDLQENNQDRITSRRINTERSYTSDSIPESEEASIQSLTNTNETVQVFDEQDVIAPNEEQIHVDDVKDGNTNETVQISDEQDVLATNEEQTQVDDIKDGNTHATKYDLGNSIFYLEDDEGRSSLYEPPSLTAQVAGQGFPSLNDASFVRQVAERFMTDYPNSASTTDWTTSKCRPSWAEYCAAMRYYPALTTNYFFSVTEVSVLLENGMNVKEIVSGSLGFSQSVPVSNVSQSVTHKGCESSEVDVLSDNPTAKPESPNPSRNSSMTRHNSFLGKLPDSHLNKQTFSTSVKLSRRHSFSERMASSFASKRRVSAPATASRKRSWPSSTNLKTLDENGSYGGKLFRRGSLSQISGIRTSRPVDWSCKSCPEPVPFPQKISHADNNRFSRQRKLGSSNACHLKRQNSANFTRTTSFTARSSPAKLFRSYSFSSDHPNRPSNFLSRNQLVSEPPESGGFQMTCSSPFLTPTEDLDHDTVRAVTFTAEEMACLGVWVCLHLVTSSSTHCILQ